MGRMINAEYDGVTGRLVQDRSVDDMYKEDEAHELNELGPRRIGVFGFT
jgi:hypothetical protein